MPSHLCHLIYAQKTWTKIKQKTQKQKEFKTQKPKKIKKFREKIREIKFFNFHDFTEKFKKLYLSLIINIFSPLLKFHQNYIELLPKLKS